MLSSLNGHLEIVKELTKAGANINAKDYHGRTALNIAERRHSTKIVQFLEQQK